MIYGLGVIVSCLLRILLVVIIVVVVARVRLREEDLRDVGGVARVGAQAADEVAEVPRGGRHQRLPGGPPQGAVLRRAPRRRRRRHRKLGPGRKWDQTITGWHSTPLTRVRNALKDILSNICQTLNSKP